MTVLVCKKLDRFGCRFGNLHTRYFVAVTADNGNKWPLKAARSMNRRISLHFQSDSEMKVKHKNT